jgi:CIC family chloride channel protein
MGTLFAGIIRAPMTSVFMIFEITQDYQILVPLMVANLLSFMISRRFQPAPVYHALLAQDDVHLPATTAGQGTPALAAGELMEPEAVLLPAEQSVEGAWQLAQANGGAAHLVGKRERVVGVLSLESLAKAVQAGRGNEALTSLVEGPILHVHPDHPVDIVLERLGRSHGILPVLSRHSARRLEGVITLDCITRFIHRRRASASADAAGRAET